MPIPIMNEHNLLSTYLDLREEYSDLVVRVIRSSVSWELWTLRA